LPAATCGADAHRSRSKDDKGFLQLQGLLGYYPPHRSRKRGAGGTRESDQDHPWCIQLPCECEPAEVFVLGQQDPILRPRKFHHIIVNGTLLRLTYRKDVMAVGAESANYSEIAAFVREKSHGRD
jgi:hypothetical protein